MVLGVLESVWLSESVRARVCYWCRLIMYVSLSKQGCVRMYVLRVVWTRRGLCARARVCV